MLFLCKWEKLPIVIWGPNGILINLYIYIYYEWLPLGAFSPIEYIHIYIYIYIYMVPPPPKTKKNTWFGELEPCFFSVSCLVLPR